jgi:hypothetical protein
MPYALTAGGRGALSESRWSNSQIVYMVEKSWLEALIVALARSEQASAF